MKRPMVLLPWVLAVSPTRAEMDRTVLLGLSASVLKIEALRVQGYTDVAPDRSRQAAWQRPVPAQPRFQKAARLQRDDQWVELESLAADWVRMDASDPEPWYGRQSLTERASLLESHLSNPRASEGPASPPLISTPAPCAIGASSSRTP